jgi:maleylacetate reductase
LSEKDITWRDGERTITLAEGAIAGAADQLRWNGWDAYELLATERALAGAPAALSENATAVHHVRQGAVNEIAAELFGEVSSERLVAFGGGRVIDTAKAIAAVHGSRVAAIPTTLSGAEMTGIHKLPDGHEAERLCRPVLVMADPEAMTAQPERERRASAMNALAHAADSLYTPLAHPVSRLAALEGARLIAAGVDEPDRRRDLALGSLLAGYAIDSALFSLHHVICQSLVRVLRVPHAETNAAILPRAVEALVPRAPAEMAELASALSTEPDGLVGRIEELSGGRRTLGEVGADRENLAEALDVIEARGELEMTPQPPDREELRRIVESAW